jgi:signal transduction histidine kinase
MRERAELDFDKKGAFLGGFGTVQDITERKRVDEALHDSQNRVKSDLYAMRRLHELGALSAHEENLEKVLVEIVDAAIAIFGADFGNIKLLNPITSELNIVAQRGFPDWWMDYWNGIGKGQGSCGLTLKRGERVIVEDIEQDPFWAGNPGLDVQLKAGVRACQATPLVSRSGKPLGVFSTHYRTPHRPDDRELQLLDLLGRQASDIIDRAQHEEALRRSRDELELRVRERTAELARKNQELQEFAYVASHDLTEPLRKILTFGDLLKTKSASLGEQESDYVSRMTGAANRMQELLDALLRYSRIETQARDFVPVKLHDIVHTVTADLEVSIKKIGAQLEIGFLPVINCDPYQWRQVFQNLIANALKYHRSEVRTIIKVYGEEREGTCRILVEDNGIGFDEKYLDKIFQPFQRLHGRNEYPGTGTGLAICKKIVERHGGTITARSTPGKGSTFIVTLPAGPS